MPLGEIISDEDKRKLRSIRSASPCYSPTDIRFIAGRHGNPLVRVCCHGLSWRQPLTELLSSARRPPILIWTHRGMSAYL